MKIFLSILIVLIMMHTAESQTIRVMSYNIRLDLESDGPNQWDERKIAMAELFSYYRPAVAGIQEAQYHQLNWLKQETAYLSIGVGRDDGQTAGEFSAILYDSTLFRVSLSNTIWLSESGETGSKGWDAAYPRICTYGLFEYRPSQQKIWIFNTHFDHMGHQARLESASLILETINRVNSEKLPVILMGDFNLTPDTNPIGLLKTSLNDAFACTEKPHYGPEGTFTGFDPLKIPVDRIDYIFVQHVKVKSIRHIDDRRDDLFFVSDHLPVLCELAF
ncbi:MAG: endonuclease/exonuclease/phosphatase family protein [Prolixibacteraceae bacterium]|nr:endonuclease/exonuclease/phosphatase family protein [Prolixibacteraceae bacterium]